MFSRIRIAFAYAILASMLAASAVSAKGGFAFITISGSGIKESIRAANGALTQDFFAFADFYRDTTDAPSDPGLGYEITRYYIDNNRDVAFDKLHYYPETGFVFYDGIVNGSSEYDGKWYTAKSEIKAEFESVLSAAAVTMPLSNNQTSKQAQPEQPVPQTQPIKSVPVPSSAMPVVLAVGLAAVVLVLFLSRRKRIVQ